MTRREWMRTAAQAAVAAAVTRRTEAEVHQNGAAATERPSFCFFSKHLPDLNWGDVGRAVRDAGYDGVDLTVRAGGHVLPEKAAGDLPRAIDAITAQGVTVPMITTDLISPGNPAARPLLKAAASKGVRFFKTGYWRFSASPDVRAQVNAAGEALAGLAALAREFGIQLGFHNHTAYIGAAIWDIAPAMDRLDPQWAGYYFDPRHAVAEGGGGAWKAATHLVLPRLKMIALKDFIWQKTAKGWAIEDCPLGDGIVDWKWMGTALRSAKFAGPVSIHLEYDIPGATAEERTRKTLEWAVKDLKVAKTILA